MLTKSNSQGKNAGNIAVWQARLPFALVYQGSPHSADKGWGCSVARKHAVLFLVLMLLGVPSASAEVSTSSINGAVIDSSGAVVAGSKMQSKHDGPGLVFGQPTTCSRKYSVPSR